MRKRFIIRGEIFFADDETGKKKRRKHRGQTRGQKSEYRTVEREGRFYYVERAMYCGRCRAQREEREGQRANLVGADEAFNRAAKGMVGVFVGDACVYNAAGGYYVGEIEKGKIKMGLKQVKQGEKGKYGEIVGRELTGKFVASTAPIYIWMRKDGTLELISGRHRFAKAMEDEGVGSVMCYVFREDAEHNELWAELLDYENNLRDDQADERTAAYYVRKFPQTDEELRAKGLLRNGTVAKRGIFIGRYARENLYNLWMSTDARLPLGRATNIEEICRMTKDIKDVSRIEDIQSTAARLLGDGESWEYINGMIHMMAQDRTAELRQGLLDMGTDYTQNLERAARYIEKVVKDLEAGIKQIKDFMANKGLARGSSARKKARSATAVGLDAGNLKYPEEKLAALIEAAEQWKMVGNYPELVSEAYMWDGETEVEKAGRICSRVEEEQDAAVEAGERARAQAEVPEGQGEMSFSAEEARERGMFGKNGVMVVGNGVVVAPGVDISAAIEGAQHASPYLFREFDTAHLGEGEGNQAYGWGLYFSTNWEVNKWYWKQFKERRNKDFVNVRLREGDVEVRSEMKWDERKAEIDKLAGEVKRQYGVGEELAEAVAKVLVNAASNGTYLSYEMYLDIYERGARRELEMGRKALEEIKRGEGEHEEDEKEKLEEAIERNVREIEAVEFLRGQGVKVERLENAVDYLVDIEVEEWEMLPWGGKVGEWMGRNEKLMEGLRGFYEQWKEAGRRIYGRERRREEWEEQMKRMREGEMSGEEFYEWLGDCLIPHRNRTNTRHAVGRRQKAASEWLLAHGVKGIRYEDGFSRRRRGKTYNYVVFDGGDVKIRKINNRGAWTSDVGGEPWENFSAAVERVDAVGMREEEGRKVAERWHAVERGAAVVCDVPEVYSADVKGVREMMKRMTAELRKEPVVFRDGTEATISGKTQREIQSHSANRRVVAAYAKIRELAAAAQYLHSAQNPGFTGEKGSNGIEQYHYYVAKGDFGGKGEAFVCIRVAEYADGSRVYDIDTDSVEGVINEKGEAPTLPATRIPNAGQEGEASLSKSRIHAVKRYVNYIDKISEKKVGEVSMSVEEAEGRGMFGGEGVMVAGNGFVARPGVELSAAVEGAQHASPYLFKAFDTVHMGEGEGN